MLLQTPLWLFLIQLFFFHKTKIKKWLHAIITNHIAAQTNRNLKVPHEYG